MRRAEEPATFPGAIYWPDPPSKSKELRRLHGQLWKECRVINGSSYRPVLVDTEFPIGVSMNLPLC